MKFLIQKINGEIVHDFSFTLLNAIKYNSWLHREHDIVKYFDCVPEQMAFQFKDMHRTYVPVGSVEFVSGFLVHFYGIRPKPLNIPDELLDYKFTKRFVFNGVETELVGKKFVKSNDKIKNVCGIFNENEYALPKGNYQISDVINIDSEWRVFVYQGKMIGLQNYCGEFMKFPDVDAIRKMVDEYKSSPITYTLDVGVNDEGTFVIECHEFFSIGLYSFNSPSYPNMLYRAFKEIINNNK